MTAPDLSRMSGQPTHDCPSCGRATSWFNPGCPRCGLNFWTGDFEPLEKYFGRRFPESTT